MYSASFSFRAAANLLVSSGQNGNEQTIPCKEASKCALSIVLNKFSMKREQVLRVMLPISKQYFLLNDQL